MGVIAIGMAIALMGDQMMLGTLYLIGGGLAVGAAAMALMTDSSGVLAPGTATSMMWLAAGAGVIGLMGSMFAGK